jgi:hypothetical protein
MSMSRDECIEQGQLMMREVIQDLTTAQTQQDLIRLEIRVQMIQAYALLAEAKRAVVAR